MSLSARPILILDFGSQVTQLIARRLRELGYYSQIENFDFSFAKIKACEPLGIILSGGPNSVYEEASPVRDDIQELEAVAPLLGICYGFQLIAQQLGGVVAPSEHREYGLNEVTWIEAMGRHPLKQKVWMSHGDILKVPPAGFRIVGVSQEGHPAALKSPRIWGVQFHPEVAHTQFGEEILRGFVSELCGEKPNWNPGSMREAIEEKIRLQAGPKAHVLCALSGGVDSSVVAFLLTKILGRDRVHCVFVNNGLLRKNEFEQVCEQYQNLGLNLKTIDARGEFIGALKGLTDPEEKRKAIGRTFIEVFEKSLSLSEMTHVEFLAQGTLYPDVIESVSVGGNSSHKIKSHHNVGGLPERMKLKLFEPVRELFKDEVRALGRQIGVPKIILDRHPFPGPGLAIRILGEVTDQALEILREADFVMTEFLREKNLYNEIWQAFCVLLPVKTVGVQGDGRSYERVLALRAVTSQDGMTADWFDFDPAHLRELSNRITNRVKGVNRVVYDVTSKPPGTIEWE